MKTRSIARGIVGSVATLLGVMAAGCSAETGAPDEAAEIGSTEQAIGVTVTEQNDFNYAAAFMGFAKIDSDEELVAGGYSTITGNVISTIRHVTYTDVASPGTDTASFAKVLNGGVEKTLNTARAELQMAEIPGNPGVFLVVGGQTSSSGNVLLASAEVINLNNNTVTTVGSLSSVRSRFGLTKCGDKLLVVGGETRSGGVAAVSAALEVFTYDSVTPANSSFATMKNADNGTTVVTLSTARKFFTPFTISAPAGRNAVDRIVITGGQDGANDLSSTEILDVNSSCQFVDNDGASTKTTPHAGPALPAVLSKYGALAKSITFTPSGGSSTTYKAVVGAGQSSSATSLKTYLYLDNATPGSASWQTGNDLLSAHVLPTMIEETSGVGFSGGYSSAVTTLNILNSGLGIDTTAEYDLVATSNGATSNPADMTNATVGHWGGFLASLPIVSHGVKWTGGGATSSFPTDTN